MAGLSGFNHLGLIAAALQPTLDKVVRKATLDVQAQAQGNVTVVTGFLKNSIYTLTDAGESSYDTAAAAAQAANPKAEVLDQVETPKAPVGGSRAVVAVGASYGSFVEMGTSKMAAQPYLQPAVDQVKPSFEAACSKLEDLLKGAGF